MFQSSQTLFMAAGLTAALSLTAMLIRPDDRATSRNMLVVAIIATVLELINSAAAQWMPDPVPGTVRDILLVVLSATLMRMVGMLIFRGLLPLVRLNPPRIIEDLTVIACFIAWMVTWWRMSGVNLSSIVATSAVITAIIAFSMQETLGNILGGVALQLDNSIRIGDWVKIDDVSGKVVEIRWRFTAIETRNRETLVVPNSYLMKNRFMVLGSRRDARLTWRRWVWFNVSLDRGATRVLEVLERAVLEARITHVSLDPPPSAVLMEVLPNGARFALRYFLTDPLFDDPTDSAVRVHGLAALERAGVKIIMPVEERLLVKENEARRAALAEAEHARRTAVLQKVDLFHGLRPEETERLAAHLAHSPFVAGDVITRQGDLSPCLYLIVAGECEVWREFGNGGRTQIATLKDGNVFGEMGVMTGAPRRATITARTDVECYRLDKEGFREVLENRPEFAQEISTILLNRNADLERHESEAGNAARQSAHSNLIAQIRDFFGIRSD
jgi:small-conductance mechanosensitive channel/CRP-like cAMP-binding protein